jgi:hypothetical protein
MIGFLIGRRNRAPADRISRRPTPVGADEPRGRTARRRGGLDRATAGWACDQARLLQNRPGGPGRACRTRALGHLRCAPIARGSPGQASRTARLLQPQAWRELVGECRIEPRNGLCRGCSVVTSSAFGRLVGMRHRPDGSGVGLRISGLHSRGGNA